MIICARARYLFLSLAAATFLLTEVADGHYTFVVTHNTHNARRPSSLGWTILSIRGGGSHEEEDSSSEYEWEDEEEEATTIDPGENDADSDGCQDLEMFLDAQEFIDENDEPILDNETNVVVKESLDDDSLTAAVEHDETIPADDDNYEDDETDNDETTIAVDDEERVEEDFIQDAINVVSEASSTVGSEESLLETEYKEEQPFDETVVDEETTTPETDFERTLSQQEDTPSTEDASQVEEPELVGEDMAVVEDASVEITEVETGDRAPEYVDEQSVVPDEPPIPTETTVSMVEAQESAATFVTATANAIPSEVDYSQQHTTDDDSMAFVDRMELADDEAENVLTEFPEEAMVEDNVLVKNEAVRIQEEDSTPPPVAVDTATTTNDTSTTAAAPPANVLTDEMKQVLIKQLKYPRREVNGMKPEIAIVLAEKRLRRPNEGIPPNWYTDQAKSVTSKRQRNAMIKVLLFPIAYAVPIALTGLAIYGSVDLAQLVSSLSSLKEGTTASTTAKERRNQADEPSEAISSSTQVSSVAENESSGIAPGNHSRIPKKQEVDESWVDKIITGIARPIKAFWDIKL